MLRVESSDVAWYGLAARFDRLRGSNTSVHTPRSSDESMAATPLASSPAFGVDENVRSISETFERSSADGASSFAPAGLPPPSPPPPAAAGPALSSSRPSASRVESLESLAPILWQSAAAFSSSSCWVDRNARPCPSSSSTASLVRPSAMVSVESSGMVSVGEAMTCSAMPRSAADAACRIRHGQPGARAWPTRLAATGSSGANISGRSENCLNGDRSSTSAWKTSEATATDARSLPLVNRTTLPSPSSSRTSAPSRTIS